MDAQLPSRSHVATSPNTGPPQQPAHGRSVEVDVQRLADIRASLQDIQRRKSAPPASSGTSKLSAMRTNTYRSSFSASQHTAENMYQPLHAARPAILQGPQQPFAPRDLNKDVKVCHCVTQKLAEVLPRAMSCHDCSPQCRLSSTSASLLHHQSRPSHRNQPARLARFLPRAQA